MSYVIGVDGGGTKTTAVVAGNDQAVVASAHAGPANGRSVGLEAAAANIASAVADVLSAAGQPLDHIAAVCLCLAGFDTDLDLPVPRRAIQLIGFEGVAIFENDVVGAWAGSTGGQPGLVVIAGTGSTALGMNARGQFWRTDGWDYILGDSGSGYDIGRNGIRAAMAALDGRGAPTRLAHELGARFGVESAEDMRRLVDSTPFGKLETASFSANVSKAADDGDLTARDILAHAGHELALQAITIIRRLRLAGDAFPIGLVGGVFKSEPWVTEPFHRLVGQAAPRATFGPSRYPPEVGAAILAWQRLRDGDHGSWTLGTGHRQIGRGYRIDEMDRI
jgi:glucosamine kinase